MSTKSFGQNLVASLRYQVKRRTQSPISSIVGLTILLGFIWVYRELALTYWPPFIKKYIEYKQIIFIAVVAGGSILCHTINFAVYYIIDKFKLFEKYKITKTGLLWEEDKEKWRLLRNKAILLNIINILIIGAGSTVFDSNFVKDSLISTQIPSYATIFSQFFFFVMVEGILFYIFHKIGHLLLYSLHKVHHQFHVPTLLATNHFHPIDYILGIVIPFATGPKILDLKRQLHIITLSVWIIFRVCEGHDGHSNYEFPWSPFRALPSSTTSQYHSFHHTHNQGNFGSTDMVPDTAMHDNSSFFTYKESKSKNENVQNTKEDTSKDDNKKAKPKRA